jgi:hypothetical protein
MNKMDRKNTSAAKSFCDEVALVWWVKLVTLMKIEKKKSPVQTGERS